MHIYFSGIGGTAIGPLAMIAKQAGYLVSGSDKQDSAYVRYLQGHGISDIHIGQDREKIEQVHRNTPIDWLVHSSAVTMENKNHPELDFCKEHNIQTSKRDELINKIVSDKKLKLIAISGTHGKTTTTAMMVWLLKQLGIPVSYSVGAKISFGAMGAFDPSSEYFIYEADEFDRNFLKFKPFLAIISGIAYDHPDIYPTKASYIAAFKEFVEQSQQVVAHPEDQAVLDLLLSAPLGIAEKVSLPGLVNRQNAALVIEAVAKLTNKPTDELLSYMNQFPGVSRRFEKIQEQIYSDYAHTPEKIAGALQMAHEVSGGKVVVVYEGLHNTRQHFIKDQLKDLFASTHKVYVVPSYLAREDETLELLTPDKLCKIMQKPEERIPSELDYKLKNAITSDVSSGSLVLCLTAGGGGSLDEWLRKNFVA